MILKNENIVKEMISILEDLHKYVPTHQEEKEIEIPEEGIIIQQKTQVIHPVYLGGDQLTPLQPWIFLSSYLMILY